MSKSCGLPSPTTLHLLKSGFLISFSPSFFPASQPSPIGVNQLQVLWGESGAAAWCGAACQSSGLPKWAVRVQNCRSHAPESKTKLPVASHSEVLHDQPCWSDSPMSPSYLIYPISILTAFITLLSRNDRKEIGVLVKAQGREAKLRVNAEQRLKELDQQGSGCCKNQTSSCCVPTALCGRDLVAQPVQGWGV